METFYRKAMHQLVNINSRLAGIRADYLHLLKRIHRAHNSELTQAADETEKAMDKLQRSISKQYFELNGRIEDGKK